MHLKFLKRLGLVEGVIKRAKAYMSEENLQFENLIRDLQEKSIVAKKEAREAKFLKKKQKNLRQDMKISLKDLKRQEKKHIWMQDMKQRK